MKTILSLLAVLFFSTAALAVTVAPVYEGNNVVRIDYDSTGEASLPIAFALDVTIDSGAVISQIKDYKTGDSTAASRGFGIYPASMKFDETGTVISFGTPDINGLMLPNALPGLNTNGVTLEFASRYSDKTNAPLTKGMLCRLVIDPKGASAANIKIVPNMVRGGIVLENASVAAFNSKTTTIVFSQIAQPPATAFLQDNDANGIISIEAENFDSKTTLSKRSWNLMNLFPGYSGNGFMRAEPDKKLSINTRFTTRSPQLAYKINFVKTGTHYIWIRSYATKSSNDSCHAGLDGLAISTCDKISAFKPYKNWVWSSKTLDKSSRAVINVTEPGTRTFNIWMREDGFSIDKIVITTNPNYIPSGTGPAESQKS